MFLCKVPVVAHQNLVCSTSFTRPRQPQPLTHIKPVLNLRFGLYNTSLFGHRMLSEPQLRSGQTTHLSVQFNCLISPPKKTAAIMWVIYIFLVCACFLSLSLSFSDFSGRLKLLYYSPRVCQIPQQLQTHHPSLALCLKGNKVSGFPGWQICVIVLCPSWGNNWVDTGGERRRKGRREKGDETGWQISLPF